MQFLQQSIPRTLRQSSEHINSLAYSFACGPDSDQIELRWNLLIHGSGRDTNQGPLERARSATPPMLSIPHHAKGRSCYLTLRLGFHCSFDSPLALSASVIVRPSVPSNQLARIQSKEIHCGGPKCIGPQNPRKKNREILSSTGRTK